MAIHVSSFRAVDSFLEAEEGEKTFKFTQRQIAAAVDVASARKVFDLDLNTFGPYSISYTRNGRLATFK